MKKIAAIGAGIAGVGFLAAGILLKIKDHSSVSVIGGADGPTSIFIRKGGYGRTGGLMCCYSRSADSFWRMDHEKRKRREKIMEKEEIQIRKASVSDAEELLGIYAPYVEKTAISFEWDVPSVSEFRRRIENTLKKYPYLVAEKDGEILGYA